MGDGRNLILQISGIRAGEHDLAVLHGEGFGASKQVIEDHVLGGREGLVEKISGDLQAGAVFQQVGHGSGIAGGGVSVGERTAVFIDAEQKQSGVDQAEMTINFLQAFDETGSAGDGVDSLELPTFRQIARFW